MKFLICFLVIINITFINGGSPLRFRRQTETRGQEDEPVPWWLEHAVDPPENQDAQVKSDVVPPEPNNPLHEEQSKIREPAPVVGSDKGNQGIEPPSDSKLEVGVDELSERSKDTNRRAEKNKCSTQRKGHRCVPYHRCRTFQPNTDGSGLINIRGTQLDDLCNVDLRVCCKRSDIIKKEPQTTPDIQPVPFDEFTCGKRNERGVHVRISGLKIDESQFAEFPWMVAVLRVEQFGPNHQINLYICGGSLIAPDLVLTAAHCIQQFAKTSTLAVRAGEYDTQNQDEVFPHEDRRVRNIIIHEDYRNGSLWNDVALLELEAPFRLESHIYPICLPYDLTEYDSLNCVASGWGKLISNGTFQNVLKKVSLSPFPFHFCQDVLRSTRLGQYFELHDSFVCAGGLKGVDTCKGDGGSPLVCNRGHGSDYFQLGIVAWGIGCGKEGIPGVYADVSKAVSWIEGKTRSPYLCRQKNRILKLNHNC